MTHLEAGLTARLRELEGELSRLRRRLLLLSQILPLEFLHTLEADLARLEEETGYHDPLDGWEETHLLTPTHVAPEMELLWKSLAPKKER
jgi:hypothetical protein